MIGFSHFEGHHVEGQGVLYADYSCPFCLGQVELIRTESTTAPNTISFRGRCVRCKADGPPEMDGLAAIEHYRHKNTTKMFGGEAIGTVLPQKIIRRMGETPPEIHVPLPAPFDKKWATSGRSILVDDEPHMIVVVYRKVRFVEGGTVYEFDGAR